MSESTINLWFTWNVFFERIKKQLKHNIDQEQYRIVDKKNKPEHLIVIINSISNNKTYLSILVRNPNKMLNWVMLMNSISEPSDMNFKK